VSESAEVNLTGGSVPTEDPHRDRPGRPAGVSFLPGAIVARRYRIAGLLGRGGMGEVYRADDLKLGQPVALKFLRADDELDADRRDRFLSEVRLSLRVTHPHVCRVFDIAEVDGRPFLSMEFVDGEDLASLLRRIGRLPEDKAIEISRQLCAGLAAAHEGGVLHCDLKPANIMIDGRGRAKIADFGLGGAVTGISGDEARVGTPQYMAPEQIRGEALSERTDLYSLGLVLYELFTGRRPFQVANFDDPSLDSEVNHSSPITPSVHVSGLSPIVEQAILRCLQEDPLRRPASARALAASLPGGDPLAMAVAAGDTPSPEMVAAAGSDAGLKRPIASALLAFVVLGSLVCGWLTRHVMVFDVAAPTRPPEVLIDRARALLEKAGLSGAERDSHWGLEQDGYFLKHVAAGQLVDARDTLKNRGVNFWYRGSPVPFVRTIMLHENLMRTVEPFDPPLLISGEYLVELDHEGRLTQLIAVPSESRGGAGRAESVDWKPFFDAAGLDMTAWEAAMPQRTPPFFADTTLAWVPREGSRSPMRIEAAGFEGRAVGFQLVFPWTPPERSAESPKSKAQRAADVARVLMFCAMLVAGVLVGRHNLRLDRADRAGALRVGAATGTLAMLAWLIDEHHVPTIWELMLFVLAAGTSLFLSAMVAVFYLSLEPYVRRTWPSVLVSWSRLLAGGIRDRLVASDVLIGCATGILATAIELGGYFLADATNTGRQIAPRPFLGVLSMVSQVAFSGVMALIVTFMALLVLFLIRTAVRKDAAALVVCAVVLGVAQGLSVASSFAVLPFFIVACVVWLATLSRAGLVAMLIAIFVRNLLLAFPFAWPETTWHSGIGFVGVILIAALAAIAFSIATSPQSRQPALRSTA
jgi:hypothetical protein